MPEVYTDAYDCLTVVKERLSAPEHQELILKVIDDHEKVRKLEIREGRGKVASLFPTIAIEGVDENDPFAAQAYTKEPIINLDIFVMVKLATEPEKVERYIMKLAPTVKSILNQPGRLRYFGINQRGDEIYDSRVEEIQYGYLYQGAIRAARMRWWGKIWRMAVPPRPSNLPL